MTSLPEFHKKIMKNLNKEENMSEKDIQSNTWSCDRCDRQIGVGSKESSHAITSTNKYIKFLCSDCHKKYQELQGEITEQFIGTPEFKEAMKLILKGLEKKGLNLSDPNFIGTPERFARALEEIFAGVGKEDEIHEIFNISFPSEYSGIVLQRDIKVFSMCPHHFLPVEYTIHVAYVPDKKTIGISKIARAVELLAKRPALQEQLTEDIVALLNAHLEPKGVIAHVTGQHFCMRMRGVKKPQSATITTAVRGYFENNKDGIKDEFFKSVAIE